MSEQKPFGLRRGISRHLTDEGALPICEQCNADGSAGPVQISSAGNGSIGFRVSRMWGHRPFGENQLSMGVPVQ